jgi:hypothetical protein
MPAPSIAPAAEHEALELDANDLVDELEADTTETATEAPPASDQAAAPPATPAKPAAPVAPIARLDFEAARRAIASTDQRGAVADAVLSYAASRYEVALLCLVRDNMLVGWKGFGPGLDVDRIETVLVPLDLASLFQAPCATPEVAIVRPTPGTLHDHFFRLIRCAAPLTAIVAPIQIGPRVVNVLYAHAAGTTPIGDAELEELRAISHGAGEAYVRLISESKRRQAARGA